MRLYKWQNRSSRVVALTLGARSFARSSGPTLWWWSFLPARLRRLDFSLHGGQGLLESPICGSRLREKPGFRQGTLLGRIGKVVEEPAIGVQLELPVVHIAVRPAIAYGVGSGCPASIEVGEDPLPWRGDSLGQRRIQADAVVLNVQNRAPTSYQHRGEQIADVDKVVAHLTGGDGALPTGNEGHMIRRVRRSPFVALDRATIHHRGHSNIRAVVSHEQHQRVFPQSK